MRLNEYVSVAQLAKEAQIDLTNSRKVDDIESGDMEGKQVAPSRQVRILATVGVVAALIAMVGVAALRINKPTKSIKTEATDETTQLSSLGNIQINGPATIGDNNVQNSVQNGDTVYGQKTNNDQSVHKTSNQNVYGSHNKLSSQMKDCEGSGNGGKAGETGSVCCKGPAGTCCAATAAAAKAIAADTETSAACTGPG
mmetsp:Transcript_49203/g.77799  ORF Transcript_49203/g.77799 Transcript_49203/m.77799 type:complete len:198 (-) Transcript_49203:102-695(-)|eukprot:CAMPEP_0169125142 /NCGR_PEP_ID=MMETSP1015-20121227/34716_1 /TAXON_ID=342587 /ORGANISM="Karlodinium micrum, Strain CCMP2283" /LENGTH=197 /DNA_ID=CAMNT_0009188637 /DNA_START=62 /DNA_END=655 /DNA_ORIENTATION=-